MARHRRTTPAKPVRSPVAEGTRRQPHHPGTRLLRIVHALANSPMNRIALTRADLFAWMALHEHT
ncbi:MAG: hypothetical protein ACRDTF_08465, partial [Pseudonocardiaceae bacterium]